MNSSKNLDWAAVREHLSAAEESLANAFVVDASRRQELLEARARQLAARTLVAPKAAGETEAVTFRLGDERYGIALAATRAVLPYRSLGRVPGAPPALHGMLAERGEIWSIFRLSSLLNLPDSGAPDEESGLLLLRHARMRLGLVIGRVEGIRTFASAELHEPVQTANASHEHALIRSITEDSLALLDIEKLWSHSSILEVLT